MMLTARFKTCALAACLLAACLLLPDTQAKAESISLPEPVTASQAQPETAAEKAESVPVLTTLSYETVVETVEEPAAETAAPEAVPEASEETSASDETPEEAPEPEAENAITKATKADMERPDDLVKLGDFIATAYCVTGQTSTGTQTTVGRTLAVNPYVIPYGTEVWLYLEDGTFAGDFIAEDTGSNMLANSNVIDIYMGEGSYHDCILWGAQNVEVYIRATAEADEPAQ